MREPRLRQINARDPSSLFNWQQKGSQEPSASRVPTVAVWWWSGVTQPGVGFEGMIGFALHRVFMLLRLEDGLISHVAHSHLVSVTCTG